MCERMMIERIILGPAAVSVHLRHCVFGGEGGWGG